MTRHITYCTLQIQLHLSLSLFGETTKTIAQALTFRVKAIRADGDKPLSAKEKNKHRPKRLVL